ncbi:uncharacterized protein LOC119234593 isoform X2 [Talpa occidentalis]|nr:uncharacterized protein LOC119234593 isoform X2 [Talpa occidentalis]
MPTAINGDEVVCKGHVFSQPGQTVRADYSLDYGLSAMSEYMDYTSKDCDPIIEPTDPTTKVTTKKTTTTMKTTRVISTTKTSTVPTTVTTKMTTESTVVTTKKTPASTTVKVKTTKLTVEPPVDPLLYWVLAPALVIMPLLICCICCCGRNKEQKQEPRKTCPLVIIPCCCQEESISRIESKLDSLCNIVLSCHQGPRDEGRCINLNLLNPHCMDMSSDPNLDLQPNLECFRLNNSCSLFQNPPPISSQPPSRMLPLTSAADEVLCSTPLPLPPP